MAVKFTYNMTLDQIDAGIASIAKRQSQVKSDMHRVVVSILYNWAQSGAVNVAVEKANRMLANCDENHRQAIVNYFCLHGQWDYDTSSETFSYGDKRTITSEEYQAAKAETMFQLSPPKPAQSPFDMSEKVMQLAQSAEKKLKENAKAIAKGEEAPHAVTQEQVDSLKSLVSE